MTEEREPPVERSSSPWDATPPMAWQQAQPPPAWQPPLPPPPGWQQYQPWQYQPWQQQPWQQLQSGARPGTARRIVIGVVVGALAVGGLVVSSVLTAHNARSTSAGSQRNASTSLTVPQWSPSSGDGTSPVVPPDGITEASTVGARDGTQMYSDDFHDAGSGWMTGRHALGTAGAGSTYSFGASGYSSVVTGPYHYFSYVPFSEPVAQISVTATATEDAGAPRTGGFGVSCVTNYGESSELRYEFLLNNSGRWFVERRDGILTPTGSPSLLGDGSSHAPDATPTTIVAVCARLADEMTNRVLLFVDDVKVADLVDVAPLRNSGWIGALMTAGGDGNPTTVHFKKVTENRFGSDMPPDDGTDPYGTGPNSVTDPNAQSGSST